MWGTVKAVLRGKFIAINAYINKLEKFKVKGLTIPLKELGKQQNNHNNNRKK